MRLIFGVNILVFLMLILSSFEASSLSEWKSDQKGNQEINDTFLVKSFSEAGNQIRSGNPKKAIVMLLDALPTIERAYGKEGVVAGYALDIIARAYELDGNYIESIKFSEKSVRVALKTAGWNSLIAAEKDG